MTDAPIELHVERLRLLAQGLDEGSARRLARLVAENLAGDVRLAGGSAALPSLSVEVAARPGEAVDETARRVAEVIRAAVARPGSRPR